MAISKHLTTHKTEMAVMHRVVVTGLGVLSPNGHGLSQFESALREGRSGIRYVPKLKELGFGCQVAGVPEEVEELAQEYFHPNLLALMNPHTVYAGIAALDCWRDAGFAYSDPKSEFVDDNTGAIIGNGMGPTETIADILGPLTTAGDVRRLGSSLAERTMCSSAAARLAGILGLGGEVSMVSSACATGTQVIVEGWRKLRAGLHDRMLVGAAEGPSHYNWAPFDSMRVLQRRFNDQPERASRPLSASSNGFVPASGSAMLMLETLESALKRNARIYCEVLGGAVTCGGHREGGSMTLGNPRSAQRCIRMALKAADVTGPDIDGINGHLTGTGGDAREIANWTAALGVTPDRFPMINSTLSLTGHSLGAAGAISSVGAVLQLERGFFHPSKNCEDLHPDLEGIAHSIPQTAIARRTQLMAKAAFGFGDVNACVVFKAWNERNGESHV